MRHERVIGPVPTLQEEGHPGDEPEHCACLLRVRNTDCDEKNARYDSVTMDHIFLPPDVGLSVDVVRKDSADWSEDNVKEAEHCRPSSGTSLAKRWEVLEIVCPQNGIDR